MSDFFAVLIGIVTLTIVLSPFYFFGRWVFRLAARRAEEQKNAPAKTTEQLLADTNALLGTLCVFVAILMLNVAARK